MSTTPSVATDLALKRTVQAPVEQKPHYAWRDSLAAELIEVPNVILLCPHGEERFALAEVADTLGKAVTNVHLAKGEKEEARKAFEAALDAVSAAAAADCAAFEAALPAVDATFEAVVAAVEAALEAAFAAFAAAFTAVSAAAAAV